MERFPLDPPADVDEVAELLFDRLDTKLSGGFTFMKMVPANRTLLDQLDGLAV